MGSLDGIVWYIDPFGAVLLLGFLVGLAVLLSIDWLDIRVVRRKPRVYHGTCWYCGEPYDGNHWCRGRRQ